MFMASKMRELFEKHDEEYRLFEEVKILEAKLKAQPIVAASSTNCSGVSVFHLITSPSRKPSSRRAYTS